MEEPNQSKLPKTKLRGVGMAIGIGIKKDQIQGKGNKNGNHIYAGPAFE